MFSNLSLHLFNRLERHTSTPECSAGRVLKAMLSTRARRRGTVTSRGRPLFFGHRRRRREMVMVIERKIWFQSLGCPRNRVDSEVMLGLAVDGSETNSNFPGTGSTTTLRRLSIVPTPHMSEADYLVVNTCGFLQSARDESKEALQLCLDQRKDGSKVIATGCMVNLHLQQQAQQRQGKRDETSISKNDSIQLPEVDAVLGSGSIDKIMNTIRELEEKKHPEMINRRGVIADPFREDQDGSCFNESDIASPTHDHNTANNDRPQTTLTKNHRSKKSFLEDFDTPRFLSTPPHYAYLKIAEGCKKRCSFCIIPTIKGRLQSKPMKQIVEEFQALVTAHETPAEKNEYHYYPRLKEVILIAQDLGDYGKDLIANVDSNIGVVDPTRPTLTNLLRHILEADCIEPNQDKIWLRLLYLYPDEITPQLIHLLEESQNNSKQADTQLCPYLDMPIQHSHSDMLRLMRRKTTSEEIIATINCLRERVPDIHIRTSLMVGFPGETEEHFNHLLNFVEDQKLDNVGVFTYSNERLAHSARLPDHVPESVKQERYHRLMEAQLEVVRRKNEQRIGQVLHVVVEHILKQTLHKEKPHGESKQSVFNHDYYRDDPDSWIVAALGRYFGQCPEIDGQVRICLQRGEDSLLKCGERYWIQVVDYDEYDLIGVPIARPLLQK